MILDLAGDTVIDAGFGQLRTVSGKDRRTIDEMSQGSKRARETSQYCWYQGANKVPRLLGPAGRSQDRKNKLPWNVVVKVVNVV